MQGLIFSKIIVALMGVTLMIVLFPIVVLAVIAYFIATVRATDKCAMCDSWFTRPGNLCGSCEVIVTMQKHEADQALSGQWQTLSDEKSHGMNIALTKDDFGTLHIGVGEEDPMSIEWKVLGRDM